jgi:ankyrin repeat protein
MPKQEDFLNQQVAPTHSDLTPIHLAAQLNDLHALLNAIENGVDVNSLTDDGWTALHFAAYEEKIEIIAKILEESGKVAGLQKSVLLAKNSDSVTPLYIANKLGGDFPSTNILLSGPQVFQANIQLPKNVRMLYSMNDLIVLLDHFRSN